MLVSAIISTYNAQRFIEGRLRNLTEQTLYRQGQLEIIVIDSASQEDERSLILKFVEFHENIHYLRIDVRETVYGSWNRGFLMAKGRYFINANTDDRFAEDGLEKLASALESHPEFDAAYGDWLYTEIENDNFFSKTPKTLFTYPEFHPSLLFYLQLTSHALMIRRQAFSKIGLFDDTLQVFGDRDWVFRFAVLGLQAIHLKQVVGLYLKRFDSVERANSTVGNKEFGLLLQYYQQPEHFVKLHGYQNIPEKKELSQFYTLTGALGIHFADMNGGGDRLPQQSLIFFRRALALDPDNFMAGNNLAVIAATQGGKKFAEENFSRLLSTCTGARRTGLEKNLTLNNSGSQKLTEYYWSISLLNGALKD